MTNVPGQQVQDEHQDQADDDEQEPELGAWVIECQTCGSTWITLANSVVPLCEPCRLHRKRTGEWGGWRDQAEGN